MEADCSFILKISSFSKYLNDYDMVRVQDYYKKRKNNNSQNKGFIRLLLFLFLSLS